MTVTSTKRFHSHNCVISRNFPTWENSLKSTRARKKGRRPASCRPFFFLSVLLFLTFASFYFPLSPTLHTRFPLSIRTTWKHWCALARNGTPPHFHFPLFFIFFIMTLRRLTFCWHNTTDREAEADLGQVKKPSNISSPPYRSKTLLWVGITGIHLNASVATSPDSELLLEIWSAERAANTVMLWPGCLAGEGVTLTGLPLFVFL